MPKRRYPPGGCAKMAQSTGWSCQDAPGTGQPTPLDWTKQLLALSSTCTCLEPAESWDQFLGLFPKFARSFQDSPYRGRNERSLRLCSLHCVWTSTEPLAQLGGGGVLRWGKVHFQPKDCRALSGDSCPRLAPSHKCSSLVCLPTLLSTPVEVGKRLGSHTSPSPRFLLSLEP